MSTLPGRLRTHSRTTNLNDPLPFFCYALFCYARLLSVKKVWRVLGCPFMTSSSVLYPGVCTLAVPSALQNPHCVVTRDNDCEKPHRVNAVRRARRRALRASMSSARNDRGEKADGRYVASVHRLLDQFTRPCNADGRQPTQPGSGAGGRGGANCGCQGLALPHHFRLSCFGEKVRFFTVALLCVRKLCCATTRMLACTHTAFGATAQWRHSLTSCAPVPLRIRCCTRYTRRITSDCARNLTDPAWEAATSTWQISFRTGWGSIDRPKNSGTRAVSRYAGLSSDACSWTIYKLVSPRSALPCSPTPSGMHCSPLR